MSPKKQKKGLRKVKDRMVHTLSDLRKETELVNEPDKTTLQDICGDFKETINDVQTVINNMGGEDR